MHQNAVLWQKLSCQKIHMETLFRINVSVSSVTENFLPLYHIFIMNSIVIVNRKTLKEKGAQLVFRFPCVILITMRKLNGSLCYVDFCS